MTLVINETNQVVKCQEPNQVAVITESETKVLCSKEAVFMEGQNLGAGAEVYEGRTGNILNYRTLTAGDNIVLTEGADEITIEAQGGGVSNIAGYVYIAKNADVTGTRDGSLGRPFATIQEAIDFFGVPTTQAEYLTPKIINVLDSSTYIEGGTLTIPTGIWTINFPDAILNCNIVWELDNAERFGSTAQPQLILEKNANNVLAGINGSLTVQRKAGGTAVTAGTVRMIGFNISGNVTIADGTNGGLTAFTTAILSLISVGFTNSARILARNANVSFSDSVYNPTLGIEVGAITSVRDSTINSQDISEYINSTVTRFIRALRLNDAGGVTFRAIGSVRNWNVDASSGSEVLTKITSFPNNALNLIKPIGSALDPYFEDGIETGAEIDLPNAVPLRARNTANTVWVNLIQLLGNATVDLGTSTASVRVASGKMLFGGNTTVQAATREIVSVSNSIWHNVPTGQKNVFSVNGIEVGSFGAAGLTPAKLTDVERDAIVSPTAGLVIYNTTTNELNFYNGTDWRKVNDSAV